MEWFAVVFFVGVFVGMTLFHSFTKQSKKGVKN